jgi:hypothetical protein
VAGEDPGASSCEHGNITSDSIKDIVSFSINRLLLKITLPHKIGQCEYFSQDKIFLEIL